MKIRLSSTGTIEAIGQIEGIDLPSWITLTNFTAWRYKGNGDVQLQSNWELLPIEPSILKQRDIDFGKSLLLEFLTGQKDIQLDNATYRIVSETFKYAESALRRGDIPQAKTELNNIAEAPPVWTAEAKSYFISKIDNYLGL